MFPFGSRFAIASKSEMHKQILDKRMQLGDPTDLIPGLRFAMMYVFAGDKQEANGIRGNNHPITEFKNMYSKPDFDRGGDRVTDLSHRNWATKISDEERYEPFPSSGTMETIIEVHGGIIQVRRNFGSHFLHNHIYRAPIGMSEQAINAVETRYRNTTDMNSDDIQSYMQFAMTKLQDNIYTDAEFTKIESEFDKFALAMKAKGGSRNILKITDGGKIQADFKSKWEKFNDGKNIVFKYKTPRGAFDI